MYKTTAKDIVKLLTDDIERVTQYLLPKGKVRGNEYCAGSIHGEAGESLKVCMSGNKKGIWKDFATEEGGDLLNLWCDTRNQSLHEAILEIKQRYGIPKIEFQPQRKPKSLNIMDAQAKSLLPNSDVANYLVNERGLSIETLQSFKIMEGKHTIIFPYYVENQLMLLKYLSLERKNEKKQIRVSKDCDPCLFGWQAEKPSSRKAALLEGEIDAMTIYQYNVDVTPLSLPFGGGTNSSHTKHKWLEYEFDRLAIFDEVYLCLDDDDAGQEATLELLERLGSHRCRVVKLPYKDANECLLNGVTADEIQKCFDSAASHDPKELKNATEYLEQVIERFYPSGEAQPGYAMPWEKAANKILFRPSNLSSWTGINGHGKSQFLGYLILHNMKQGARVCIASLEIKPDRLLYLLTRQAAALRTPTKEYVKAIQEWYADKLWIFDLVGTAKSERILEVFEYARCKYGIDVFVIDSFTKCGIPVDNWEAQKSFLDKLCDFKNEHDCHVHLVVHSRKGEDESKPPGKMDIRGSGSISDLADNCFTVFRNKLKEDAIQKIANPDDIPQELTERFDGLIICDKQREGEWEGKLTAWFDKDSLQYLPSPTARPKRLVEYSNQNRNED